MPARLEKDFQKSFLKSLRGIRLSNWDKISNRHGAGIPDILGTVRGKFIAIELKRDGERLSALQEKKLRTYEKCGALVFAVDSKNAKEVLDALRNFASAVISHHVAPSVYSVERYPSRLMPKPLPPAKAGLPSS